MERNVLQERKEQPQIKMQLTDYKAIYKGFVLLPYKPPGRALSVLKSVSHMLGLVCDNQSDESHLDVSVNDVVIVAVAQSFKYLPHVVTENTNNTQIDRWKQTDRL